MDQKEKPAEQKKPESPAATTEAKRPPAPPSVSSKAVRKVNLAAIAFSDAQTGKSYRPGDEVEGWDDERVQEYLRRSVIYQTTQAGPSEVK